MLDDLLKSAALQESIVIPEGWSQGRACYGGSGGGVNVQSPSP
jgi:hypothetical protein